ncbi:3-dehydroquinate synthase II [archaeon SCG-AAA382B04]|nr:3-dehydroquinate synthase II [archaeon SCG-AAA382B04]
MTKLWLDQREYNKKFVTAALERGYNAIWTSPNKVEQAKKLGEINVASTKNADIKVVEVTEKAKIDELEKEDVGYVVIENKEDEELAKKVAEKTNTLLIRTTDWEIIPLENLIANIQKKDVELIVGIQEPREAETVLNTLEIGVDGVYLNPNSVDEITKLVSTIEDLEQKSFKLKEVEIQEVKEVGMGDRVCIDTSSLMNIGEGMLVGSSSKALFLVHSESLDTEYADPRPFRVNAGGVHNYIQADETQTKYLSELSAGDPVLVVDKKGNAREAFVGRSKIEKRPMMLIKAKTTNDEEVMVVLQNAETINLVTPEGKPVSVAELDEGDRVLAKTEEKGRHFGEEIEETITEK